MHQVLRRELYRGAIVWNRTRKRNRWGEKARTERPEGEWLTVPAPHLRIVSEELWNATHARIAAARGTSRGGGRPKTTEPRYLLTGFARCSCCNGGLHVRSQQGGSPGHRMRARFYACTTHFNRGRQACGNDLRVRIETVDETVLARIGEILTPSLADEVIVAVRELLAPHQLDPRAGVDAELANLDRQIGNMAEAIAMGGNLSALVTRLQQAEERRRRLLQQREEVRFALPIDWRVLERQAREKLASWRTLARQHVSGGRQLLQALLTEPLVFTPFAGSARGYRFRERRSMD